MKVIGKQGMVASAHPLISQSGINILKAGGLAIDAAIAMANTAGVVLPDMCGIGGDAFLLYYNRKENKVYAINGSGEIPKAYDTNHKIKKYGMTSVSVPGCVSTCFKALELWGTKDFKELSKDAIKLAKEGVLAPKLVVRHMHTDLKYLKNSSTAKLLYLNSKEEPLTTKDLIINKEYAKSLEYLNNYGVDGFYKGEIARKIINHSKQNGGYFEMSDLENYQAECVEPLILNYRGYEIYQTPPVSQGYLHLMEMGILSHFDLINLDEAKRIHYLIESKKLAFNHREIGAIAPKTVLKQQYTHDLSNLINDKKANLSLNDPYVQNNGHTTSFVVTDKEGNGVSFILSIAGTWGSMEVVKDTGILLNNRAGVGLNTIINHPNSIHNRRKAIHTLNTWLIKKDDKLKYLGNTPGGDYQVMWNMQLISNLIDKKKDVWQAVSAPKFRADYQKNQHTVDLEVSFGTDTIDKLKTLGHQVKIIPENSASGASELIEIKEDGSLEGASDPRSMGIVKAY